MAFLESALSILGNSGSNEHNLRDLEACSDKLVPFVGAGLSAAFDYPGWKAFLQGLAKGSPILAEVDRLLSKDQYEEAAQTLENHLKEKFNETIRDTFDTERVTRPLRKGAVRYVPNIARGPVITTNFDGILEAAFTDAGKDFTRFYPGNRIRDANEAIQLRRRALLKLHGDFRDPYSRVLTLDEYRRAYGPAKSGQIQWDLPIPRVLQQAIGGNPLLFLGCSLVTDRTTAIIAQVAKDLPGIQHFALLSASENTPDRCRQLTEWRVRPLFFPTGQFGKIEEFLACLAGFLTPKKRTAPSTVTRQYLTSFVGREDELGTLKTLLLEGSRLVTVTGPAGCGKTRLAVEAAEALRGEFADGVYFVPLDEIDKPELVLPEIGRKLGIKETAGEGGDPAGTSETKPRSKTLPQTLEEYLRERQVLLVLDNFEHVIDAARSIAVLASAGNQLSILVTSRERLHAQGEYEVNIDPLTFPDPDHLPDAASLLKYSAVELFSSRAQGAVRGFAVTPQNSRAVATICQKVDGLPLAIELAAARLDYYSLESMVSHLESRLTFLAKGPSDLPKRSQKLRDSIDWSHQLLDTAEQKLFRRLSVFAGSFDRCTAEAVCRFSGDAQESIELTLESLADKSLLKWDRDSSEPRYRMLGVIREFARELLDSAGEAADLQTKFDEYFVEATERHLMPFISAEEHSFEKWLDREIPNLRAVLESAVQKRDASLGLHLAIAMRVYWLDLGHVTEGRQHLAKLLDLEGAVVTFATAVDEPHQRSWWEQLKDGLGFSRADEPTENFEIGFPNWWGIEALQLAAALAVAQNDYESAKAYLERLRVTGERLGDPNMIESAVLPLGIMNQSPADAERLAETYEHLLRTSRERGDEQGEARILQMLATMALRRGDTTDAKSHLNKAEEILTRRRDDAGIAVLKVTLAEAERREGKSGFALLEETLLAARRSRVSMAIAAALQKLAQAQAERGDFSAAAAHLQECLEIGKNVRNPTIIAGCLCRFGRLSIQTGKFDQAESYLKQSEQMMRDLGNKVGTAEAVLALAHLAVAQRKPPERLSEAIQLFRAAGRREGEGECLRIMGEGGWNMARYEEALKAFEEARKLYESLGDKIGAANTIVRIAHAHRDRNEYDQALQEYEKARALFEANQSDSGVANCMKFAADICRRQKNTEQAKKQYEQTLAFCRKTNEKNMEAACLLALGDLYVEMKE